MRILVAEDDPVSTVALVGVLEKWGHTIQAARDGRQAWEALQRDSVPEIAILDWMMPGLDGLAVARRLRGSPGLEAVYVIMLTAKGGREDRLAAFAAGVDDFLTKPFDVEELSARLKVGERVIALQRQLAARADRAETDYRRIVETAAEGIWQIDEQFRTTFVNQRMAEMLGFTVEEMAGQPLFGFMDDAARVEAERNIEREKQGFVEQRDFRFRRADGSDLWTIISTAPIHDENGTYRGAFGMFTDITRRKLAEQALERQFARLSLLNQLTRAIAEHQDIESILRVVLSRLVDLLPVDAATVFLYDQAAGVFRVRMQEARADVPVEHLGGGQGAAIPCVATGLGICLEGQTIHMRDTTECVAPDLRHLARLGLRSGVATPLAVGEQVLGVLGVLRRPVDAFFPEDVDFMRQLSEHVALAMNQALLQDNLKAACDELSTIRLAVLRQERLRALGQMSSGIAHDINNALSPITLLPDLLLQREKGLSEESRKFLHTIQTAATDIEHTVARMREFYRQRDEQEPLISVDLNNEVREVVDLTRPRWRDIPQQSGRTVRIETVLEPNLPAIPGMPSELREALTNLILNAVDALPEGGMITVGTEITAVKAPSASVAAENRITLWVRDTGVGMDEQTKVHCLEPFVTSKGDRGTGLGLAMVYGIAQRHGAAIEIESALGSGTTFRLVFSIRENAGQMPPEADVSENYSGPPLRILCIDDDPGVCTGLQEALSGDGHDVACAEGGAAGIAMFRAARADGRSFEVVITDLGMPDVDGREVVRTVRSESPETPVILLSGWGRQLRSEGGVPEGVALVLDKPPRIGALRKALVKVMGVDPCSSAGDRPTAEGKGKDIPQGMGTILVMDDDENMRYLASRAFEMLWYTVDCACSSTETVDLYRRKLNGGCPYTAVVLDLNIPGGPGGLETLALLRELNPGVTALVSSGASEDPAVQEFRRFGFSGVIDKPFRYKDISTALQALVVRSPP